MGMFWSSGSRITKDEFKRGLMHLSQDHGFSHEKIDKIEQIFRGDLYESGDSAGISREELNRAMTWMKHHPEDHHLSPESISKVESVFGKYL
jgi:hypothetical protein